MVSKLKAKLKDMGTIKRLCEQAEAYAFDDGQQKAGAEHFLLAAIDLPDGTASSAIENAGGNPKSLRSAIAKQYEDALQKIGIDTKGLSTSAESSVDRTIPPIFDAGPSGQAVMKALASNRRDHGPLLGAHVVAAVADMPHGVSARALRTMGVDRNRLRTEAEALSQKVSKAG